MNHFCDCQSPWGTVCPETATALIGLHFPCGCRPDRTAAACDMHAKDPYGTCGHCGERLVKSEPVRL